MLLAETVNDSSFENEIPAAAFKTCEIHAFILKHPFLIP